MIEKLMITITLTAEFTVIGHNFNEHVMVVVSQMLIEQGVDDYAAIFFDEWYVGIPCRYRDSQYKGLVGYMIYKIN